MGRRAKALAKSVEHWEADVVLSDGRTAHIRPITPADGSRLREFHRRCSPETLYFRFFAPMPELSDKDLKRFTTVDHDKRVALVATVGDDIVGVARYDRLDDRDAEVAFLISDDHQGRGLGSILLEHLAAAARERGVQRFVADVLPENRRMIATFSDAGYNVARRMEDGVYHLTFDIELTGEQVAVTQAREQRAEARSIGLLLDPKCIVVIGASRTPGRPGFELFRNIKDAHPKAHLYAVHPEATQIMNTKAFRTIAEVPMQVDTAVIALPASQVLEAVEQCGAAKVASLVVISDGFAETGSPEGAELQAELVRTARGNGMRVLGPNSLGLVNTDPRVKLNLSLNDEMPPRGRAGLFTQTGALGLAALKAVTRRGIGISDFVNAGNRADISGNDLMQYWETDSDTSLVLLYLESIGNPRKFTRIARHLSVRKPVIAVRPGRTTQLLPLGHRVRRTALPPQAVDAVFNQSGVIQTRTLEEMCDVAALLSYQPLPSGRRVALIGNAEALSVLAAGVGDSLGLTVSRAEANLPQNAPTAAIADAVQRSIGDQAVDAVVVIHVPPPLQSSAELCAELLPLSEESTKPILLVLPSAQGEIPGVVNEVVPLLGNTGEAARGSVPVYHDVESAMETIARVADYANWTRREIAEPPEIADLDIDRAQNLVDSWMAATALTEAETGESIMESTAVIREVQVDGSEQALLNLSFEQSRMLLQCFGIRLWPTITVTSEAAAVEAADRLGYPVVLKSGAPWLSHRIDLGGVRTNLETEDLLRSAYLSMAAQLGQASDVLVVQGMAPPGVACTVSGVDDALFGPVVEFGLGGPAAELLGDRSYRIPPLSLQDAQDLIDEPRAAPLLSGYRGALSIDRESLCDVVLRVSRIIDEIPEVAFVRLNPLIAGERGCAALGARIALRRVEEVRGPQRRMDFYE